MAITSQELEAFLSQNPNVASQLQNFVNTSGNYAVQNPSDLGQFYNYADMLLRPEFSEGQRYTQAGFEDALNNTKTDYNQNLATAKETVRQNVFNYDDQLGRTGSYMFSEPARQRKEMINQTQRSFDQAKRSTASRLSDIARQYEYQYGSPSVSKYNFKIDTAGINDRGNISGGNFKAYKPLGNMEGTLKRAYASQLETLAGNKYGAANSPLQFARQ